MQENTISEEGFVRDDSNQALLCADIQKRNAFMRKREESQRLSKLEQGFCGVKDDITEIKQLLAKLIETQA